MRPVTNRRGRTRGWLGRLGVLSLALAVMSAGGDLLAVWYLRSFRGTWTTRAASQHRRPPRGRAAVVSGRSLDGNAAPRYLAALATIRSRARKGTAKLRPMAAKGFAADPAVAERLLEEQCGEIPRIDAALRSAFCDWRLGETAKMRGGFEYFSESRLVADCLTLNAQQLESRRDWTGAAQRYLEATYFAADLGAGDVLMNMAGISVASESLSALGRLAASTRPESPALDEVLQGLAGLRDSLPSLSNGLHFESPRLATLLALQERSRIARLPGFRGFPWHALEAWRLYRDGVRLNRLLELDDEDKPVLWDSIVGALEDRSAGFREGWPYLREALPASARLRRLYDSVVVAFMLRDWHRSRGSYPTTLANLSLPAEPARFSYTQTGGGTGYKLGSSGATGGEASESTTFEAKP
jgi:hypothetical protein